MKKCTKCGNETADTMNFCPACGASMPEQTDETLTGEIIATDNPSEQDGAPMANRKIRKYNIGHLGVVIASALALISTFLTNSGMFGDYSILVILSRDNKGDGRTYVMILAILLIITIATGCFRKNLLMVVLSIVSMGWILYMFITCGASILKGMGLLLFLLGGILLVISSIAAWKIGKNQQA